jgi:hypothetical protein
MRVLAVIAAALLVLFVASCHVEVRWWSASGASNIPAAKDANRILDATYGARLDASFQNLYAKLDGMNINTPAGTSILLHEVPGVASRITEESDAARRRVAAVPVATPTGERLREVVQRALLAERVMYQDLVSGLASRRTARQAFARWVRRYNRLQRWFAEQLTGVVREAPFEDRAAVVAALNRF